MGAVVCHFEPPFQTRRRIDCRWDIEWRDMDQSLQTLSLRAREIGVMLAAARLSAGKGVRESAEAIAVSEDTYLAYEQGVKSPSLPELEILAYYFDVPLERLWEEETPAEEPHSRPALDAARLLPLRHRILGASLRQLRSNSGKTFEQISAETGILADRLQRYELGATPIPFPELEMLVSVLGGHLEAHIDQRGPVGIWRKQQQAVEQFMKMPVELQEFITKPVNLPYLQLAQRLSGLPVERLRAIAEGLLEITF